MRRGRLALLDDADDLVQLDHQLAAVLQAAGRVDHQGIVTHFLRVLYGTADERHRVVGFLVLIDRNANRTADNP